VRKDQQRVAHRNFVDRDIRVRLPGFPVCDGWHPLGERFERARGPARRKRLERCSPGEHQDHDRSDQIFPQQDRRHNRSAGEKVRTKLPGQEPSRKDPHQRRTTEHSAA
jgi:hypothetical protein